MNTGYYNGNKGQNDKFIGHYNFNKTYYEIKIEHYDIQEVTMRSTQETMSSTQGTCEIITGH